MLPAMDAPAIPVLPQKRLIIIISAMLYNDCIRFVSRNGIEKNNNAFGILPTVKSFECVRIIALPLYFIEYHSLMYYKIIANVPAVISAAPITDFTVNCS